jgi:tetratricopeptide (TPR) repeat protein
METKLTETNNTSTQRAHWKQHKTSCPGNNLPRAGEHATWRQLANSALVAYNEGDFHAVLRHIDQAFALNPTAGFLSELFVLTSCGKFYYQQGALGEATSHLELALKIEDKSKVGSPAYVECLSTLGLIRASEGKETEALGLFARCTAASRKVDLELVFEQETGLGMMYEAKGDLPLALRHHKAALEAGKKLDPMRAAMCSRNVGTILSGMGQFAEAKTLLEGALKAQRRVLGKSDFQIGVTLNNLAEMYGKKAEFLKALDYFTQALDVMREQLGDDNAAMGNLYFNQGSAAAQVDQFDLAKRSLKRAKEIRTEAYGAHSEAAKEASMLLEFAQQH